MTASDNSFGVIAGLVGSALLVAACAAPAPIPATTQPALSIAARPYADGMRKAGIQTAQVFEGSPRVRMSTRFGDVYFRYPPGLPAAAFAVYVEPQAIEVDSDTYNASNSAAYEAAIKAVLPVCIQRARANNKWAMEERIESESR